MNDLATVNFLSMEYITHNFFLVSFDLKRCLQSGEQMIYILLAIYQGVEMLNYESEEEKNILGSGYFSIHFFISVT